MRQLHYLSWAGYALIAFMIVPVIKAENGVINQMNVQKAEESVRFEVKVMNMPISQLTEFKI